MRELTFRSHSPEATRELAVRLGRLLEPGDVVALVGELGAGKTEFVRGLAAGLDVPPEVPVSSPSFVLAHDYPGRLPLAHLDLYRLGHLPPEFLPDLEEYLFGEKVAAVEWAERLGELLPENYLEVRLTVTGELSREITLIGHGPRGEELVAAVAASLSS